MSDFVIIARFDTYPEAHIVKGKLESQGIPCFIRDENMIGLNWFYSNLMGGIKLQVPEEFLEKAKKILELQEEIPVENIEDTTNAICPSCGSNNTEKEKFSKGYTFLAFFLTAIAIPFPGKYLCYQCGHRWKKKTS